MNVFRRRLGIVAALVVLLTSTAVFRIMQSKKSGPPKREEPAVAVRSVQVRPIVPTVTPTEVDISGRLIPYERVEIFAEVGGVMQRGAADLKEGVYFNKGALLCKIDDTESRFTLYAQRSGLISVVSNMMADLRSDYPQSVNHWLQWLDKASATRDIPPLPSPIDDRERYLVANRNIENLYYQIKATEERLNKYNIVSPISGSVAQALVSTGTVIRAGQKLAELISSHSFELEGTVPVAAMPLLKTGQEVVLRSDDLNRSFTGHIVRLADQVDPTSQNARVFVKVRGDNLREGLFLYGKVKGGAVAGSVTVPRTLLVDNTGLFIVGTTDSTLTLVKPNIVHMNKDHAVLSGLPAGGLMVADPPAGLIEGQKVNPIKS